MKTARNVPWLFYDGTCAFCRRSAAWTLPLLRPKHFRYAALQSRHARAFQIHTTHEMKIVTHDRRVLGGADAVAYAATFFWWGLPFRVLWRLPVMQRMFRRIYAAIAASRSCNGACTIARPVRPHRSEAT
jgi:predicted DCC family thiol-disulfide oxidoreductase YuxK